MGIGKWIKKGAVSFVLATGGVGTNALSQSNEDGGSDTLASVPMSQNQLMRDLKNGTLSEEVKQFRKHHYQVLQASEKYKIKWGKDGDFKVLTEGEVASNRIIKGDPYDNYVTEVAVENKSQMGSLLSEEVVYPVKVQRTVQTNCKIEEVSERVHVRDIDGVRKLIEFYVTINEKPENRMAMLLSEQLMRHPGITDFNNITNISFTTTGGNAMGFSYKMLAFDKVVEYNGSYIIKMFAEVIKNGEWIGERYMITD